ncbi:uncharacterized protein UDID_18676 [Ustilago sp. UG-2017a]|nr:uncharacterized protein UDID_18676 [Ustilago sp. UG-2017a]
MCAGKGKKETMALRFARKSINAPLSQQPAQQRLWLLLVLDRLVRHIDLDPAIAVACSTFAPALYSESSAYLPIGQGLAVVARHPLFFSFGSIPTRKTDFPTLIPSHILLYL